MRPLTLFLLPVAAGLLLQAQGPAPGIMAPSEVRVGMKGHGRTVFKGGKIERFEFEVLGVQRNTQPGRTVIWVKASGGPLAETGIMQGMSGSPCYIDGKLLGALALGLSFEKEPIGGITPITEMLEQLKELPDALAPRTPLILPRIEPPKVLKSALQGQMLPLAELMGPTEAGAVPIPVSGPALGAEAQALWKGLPVTFQAAALGSGSGGAEASPLEPGGMAAVMLVQGDLEMAASGTITHIQNKRVLLFGHQLFNLGAVDLPLWSASVAASVPSYQSSFKMAPVGALRLDRSSGVAGILGAEARMVPMRLGLNLGGKRNLNFRFELMDAPFVTPTLAATVLMQALSTHLRGQGFQSLALQGNVKVAGHPPIAMEYMLADLHPGRMVQYVGGLLQAITLNPFERPVIEGISLTVKAEERLDLTSVAGVRTLKARVKRGENLPVLVTLQNIQGVRETATLNVPVPASAKPGRAFLMVGDGLSLAGADPDERAIDVANLGDVVRLLNGSMRNNHAYALLVQDQPGAGLRGSRIEGLPPTAANLLNLDGDASDNRLKRRIIGRALLPLEREVRGLMRLEVEVE